MLIYEEGMGEPLLPVLTTGGLVGGWVLTEPWTDAPGPLAPPVGSAGKYVSELGLWVNWDRAVSHFPLPLFASLWLH